MKKLSIVCLAVVMAVAFGYGNAFADPEGIPDAERLYKFNIIGMQNPKNVNMDQGSGKVIFVDLNGKSQINLVCSDDQDVLDMYDGLGEGEFAILDKDATDSNDEDASPGAILALPDPGLDPYVIGEKEDEDVWSNYSIYIRSLGKPEGWASITTCAEVLEDALAAWLSRGDIRILNIAAQFGGFASIEQVGQSITERPRGKSIFTNVTAQLLTIVLKVEIMDDSGAVIDTIYVRIPIFDEMLENEYWEYDNHGLKLLQVWIYDNETDVSAGDGDLPEL
jgi:hypothetical protein